MTETNLVTQLLTTVQTSLLDNIGAALPASGAVFATVAGIFIGIKIFKKVTGARA